MAGWVVSRREAPNPSLKHATGASCLSAQGPEPKAKVLEPRCTWWGQGRLAPRPRSPVRAWEPRPGPPAGLPQGLKPQSSSPHVHFPKSSPPAPHQGTHAHPCGLGLPGTRGLWRPHGRADTQTPAPVPQCAGPRATGLRRIKTLRLAAAKDRTRLGPRVTVRVTCQQSQPRRHSGHTSQDPRGRTRRGMHTHVYTPTDERAVCSAHAHTYTWTHVPVCGAAV